MQLDCIVQYAGARCAGSQHLIKLTLVSSLQVPDALVATSRRSPFTGTKISIALELTACLPVQEGSTTVRLPALLSRATGTAPMSPAACSDLQTAHEL